jgi:hypothetical protein
MTSTAAGNDASQARKNPGINLALLGKGARDQAAGMFNSSEISIAAGHEDGGMKRE